MTLAIAHRGESREHVENTLPAISAAIALGADVVEVDVRLTADGVPVLHHDPALLRLWSLPGLVGELSLAGLRDRVPSVPTLVEALDGVRGSGVPLLLDVEEPGCAVAAYRAVCRAGHRGSAWFSGTVEALSAVRSLDRGVPLLLTWHGSGDPGEQVLRAVAPTYLNPLFVRLNPVVLERWHRRGWGVCTWTVDDARYQRRLIDWGVDAIISNELPTLVEQVRRGATPGPPVDDGASVRSFDRSFGRA